MALNFKKLSILVVEDTKAMRHLIVSVLDALDIGKVYWAKNGEEGFEMYRQHNPDIILTDWVMKPIDGIELIREIRNNPLSQNKSVPIIIITGYSARLRVEEARDNGVTEFLVKPFTAADLAKRIGYVINRPRSFVQTKSYFGPDRRRRRDTEYKGSDKRKKRKIRERDTWEI